jgi:hypothetical protein
VTIAFREKSDLIGAMASSLCMVHCIATPFLFIASACTETCCASAPTWWVWLDFVFIIISFVAVYRSTKTSSKSWMKLSLWIAWIALLSSILIEQSGLISSSMELKYIAAFALIGLHFYNLKYCQCKSGNCCTNNGKEITRN